MDRLDWFLAFASMTFPIFLIIPALVVAFKHITPKPTSLNRVFFYALLELAVVVGLVGYRLWRERADITLAALLFSSMISYLALQKIIDWITRENIKQFVRREESHNEDTT